MLAPAHTPARAIAIAAFLLFAPQPLLPATLSSPAPLSPDPAALAAITTKKYPDADTVLVDGITSTHYAADGSSRTRNDSLHKILTEKGLREGRTRTYHYNTFYEDLRITFAQIIHPDGSTTPIDIAAHTKEMTDRSQMSANIYDLNNKVLTLSLPGLKIGDTLQIIHQRDQKRPPIKDIFAGGSFLESPHPILRGTFEIRGPKTTPLRSIALLDKVGDTVTHSQRDITNPDGSTDTIHTWVARDVPQYFPEPSMPAPAICTQRILASTAASWEEISQWYARISEPHLTPTPAIRAKVAELTTPAKPNESPPTPA